MDYSLYVDKETGEMLRERMQKKNQLLDSEPEIRTHEHKICV